MSEYTELVPKPMVEIGHKPMLWHIVERLKECQYVDKIVVATSVEKSDDPIEKFCKEQRILFSRGSLNNVFKRYLISSDTGTGKTITLFLPLLIDQLQKKKSRIIYISPLKSIISDLFENLNKIVSDLNIKIRVGKRTGDDSYIYKKKQIENPEEILLTTPESLALMITRKEVDHIFKSTTYLAIDELNEIINTCLLYTSPSPRD